MHLIKSHTGAKPRISLILLDWSVRESFHLLHYLEKQDIERNLFEVVVIEYYDTASPALKQYEHQINTWILLQMPRECCFHKHLMYNTGLIMSRGEILVICDSDAMVGPGFIKSILDAFQGNDGLVLHLDEFRNERRDFYPFNFPSFDDVRGKGCLNSAGMVTSGLADRIDLIHQRNYGACMCARRSDLLAIGGADEHADYLGHICGPYEMTFRLLNLGRRIEWSRTEFLFHTWHPGQDGTNDVMGPHDGRNMSTAALEALASGRTRPLVENKALRQVPRGTIEAFNALKDLLADPDYRRQFFPDKNRTPPTTASYKGFRIMATTDGYKALLSARAPESGLVSVKAASMREIKAAINSLIPIRLHLALALTPAMVGLTRVNDLTSGLKRRSGHDRSEPAATAGEQTAPLRPYLARLLTVAKKLPAAFRSIRLRIRYRTSALVDIQANCFLFRPEKGALWLLVEDKAEARLLTRLKRLGDCPWLEIIPVNGPEEILAHVREKQNGHWAVSRLLFIQHHNRLAPAVNQGELLVF